MGYYSYQSGLIYRHLNQSGGWDSHLEHCRSFILNAVNLYKPEKVTVLGSGWLLELPLAEMIESISRITLVDIVHPPEVFSQTKSFKNIEMVEADVTGGLIDEVWQKARQYSFFNRLKSLESINIPEYRMESDPGMVISLNVLTQLESLLIDFLKKKAKIREEDYNHFRAVVQQRHIDFLAKHRSVLISDFSEVTTRKNGEITTNSTLIADLPVARLKEEWTWDFDQRESDYYNSTSTMKVIALAI
jgi:hypothetical protein